MKVYRISFSANVVAHSRDRHLLEETRFSGTPFPNKWKRVELEFKGKARPMADFYSFGCTAFVCSDRVALYSGALWDEGEFLPVRITGRKAEYHLYNVTNCRSHLNPRNTIWETDKTTGARIIKSPAFHADRLGEDCIFKIPEDGATAIYCLERNDVPGFESLRTLVKRHGLTGLEFKLVWSDKPAKSKRRR